MIYIQPPDFHHFNFYSPDYLSICIYSLFFCICISAFFPSSLSLPVLHSFVDDDLDFDLTPSRPLASI